MRQDIRLVLGRPPTQAEIDAALERARNLRSQEFHSWARRFWYGVGENWRCLQRNIAVGLTSPRREAFAPLRVDTRPFWGRRPRVARWLHARMERLS